MKWVEELRSLLRRATRGEGSGASPGDVSCEEAAERVFEWLDGELDPELEKRIGAHLETCARCFPIIRFERAFREALARAGRAESAPDDLRSRILKRLDEEKL